MHLSFFAFILTTLALFGFFRSRFFGWSLSINLVGRFEGVVLSCVIIIVTGI